MGFRILNTLLTGSEIPPNHLKDVLNDKKIKGGPLQVINGVLSPPVNSKKMGNWGYFNPYKWSYARVVGPCPIPLVPVNSWLPAH